MDGLFFNMFGNQSQRLQRRDVGLCHCDACRAAYRKLYRREIPERAGRRLPQVHADERRAKWPRRSAS